MTEPTTQEVVLNPGREEVYNIIRTAVNDSAGDPSQTFADIVTAMVVIGHMAAVNMDHIESLIEVVDEAANVASELLIKELTPNG